MFGRGVGGLCVLFVFAWAATAAAGTLKEDLAALEGAWISGPVKDVDRKGSGTIKLQFTAMKGSALKGRGSIEVNTKRNGSTYSSTRTFTFRLVEKEGVRNIVAPGPSGTGLSLRYRLQGGRLILTGDISSQSLSYKLRKVTLKRTGAK
jgi:hypothetical protein